MVSRLADMQREDLARPSAHQERARIRVSCLQVYHIDIAVPTISAHRSPICTCDIKATANTHRQHYSCSYEVRTSYDREKRSGHSMTAGNFVANNIVVWYL